MNQLNTKSYGSWVDSLIQEHKLHLNEVKNHQSILENFVNYSDYREYGKPKHNNYAIDKNYCNNAKSDSINYDEPYVKSTVYSTDSNTLKGMNIFEINNYRKTE